MGGVFLIAACEDFLCQCYACVEHGGFLWRERRHILPFPILVYGHKFCRNSVDDFDCALYWVTAVFNHPLGYLHFFRVVDDRVEARMVQVADCVFKSSGVEFFGSSEVFVGEVELLSVNGAVA